MTPQADINALDVSRSLIDLSAGVSRDFGLEEFVLCKVFKDIVLVELIDITDDGATVKRGNLFLPTNNMTNAWRKGRILLKGSSVHNCEVGDIVVYPNDKGAVVSNIYVDKVGLVKHCCFLNEERIFGIARDKTENDTIGA